MKKAKWRTCKITAALLTVLMLMSMFSELGVGLAIPASAAETKNLTIREADPSTMDDYQTVLDLDSQEDGSRYAGRLWSDKSVFAYGENGADGPYNGTTFILCVRIKTG